MMIFPMLLRQYVGLIGAKANNDQHTGYNDFLNTLIGVINYSSGLESTNDQTFLIYLVSGWQAALLFVYRKHIYQCTPKYSPITADRAKNA